MVLSDTDSISEAPGSVNGAITELLRQGRNWTSPWIHVPHLTFLWLPQSTFFSVTVVLPMLIPLTGLFTPTFLTHPLISAQIPIPYERVSWLPDSSLGQGHWTPRCSQHVWILSTKYEQSFVNEWMNECLFPLTCLQISNPLSFSFFEAGDGTQFCSLLAQIFMVLIYQT